MPTGNRVVIRTSWLMVSVSVAAALIVSLVLQFALDWQSSIGAVIGVATAMIWLHYVSSVELTGNGIAFRWWTVRLVPWQHIDSITQFRMLGGGGVRIHDAVRDENYRLPAPQSFLGIGRREVTETQQLIEQWWVAYRGTTAQPVQPQQAPVAPDPTFDPYAPPKDE